MRYDEEFQPAQDVADYEIASVGAEGGDMSLNPSSPHTTCRAFDIRIAHDGQWFHEDAPILRKDMVCLFASIMTRKPDGSYWLVSPGEAGRIEVEDAPFLAVEMFVQGQGKDQKITFRTNVDELVNLDRLHPLRVVEAPETGEPMPYVMVRDAEAFTPEGKPLGLEARLARAVFYQLVDLATQEVINGVPQYGVWSDGIFYTLESPVPSA
jgi:hypothetical protein